MKRLVIIAMVGAALLAGGVAIAVAATRGGSQSSKRGPATVSVRRISGAGSVLVDAHGRALYRNDEERSGTVRCTVTCVSFWKPLIVTGTPRSGSMLAGTLGFARRPDGRRQATYNGSPLYTFTLDRPGTVTGDGVRDAFGGRKFTWHVAHPNAVESRPATTSGSSGGNTYVSPGY